MSENAIIVLGICLAVFFLLVGAAVPVLVFWYNREDARIFDDMRARFLEEMGRLQLDVDELHEERRQRVIRERDLEIQMGVNIALGNQIAELQRKLESMEERIAEEVRSRNDCANKIKRLEERVKEMKAQNDGWMRWYMLVLEQFTNLDITPPPDAPAGPLLPRDGG